MTRTEAFNVLYGYRCPEGAVGAYEELEKEYQALAEIVAAQKTGSVIQIGKFTITKFGAGFWIGMEDGEGMNATREKLEAAIAKFYADEF